MRSRLHLLLLGTLGSGKGTQGKLIEQHYGIPHLAAGDLLRQEIKDQTPLGRTVKGVLDSGKLVDDHLIIEVMRTRFAKPDCQKGYVVDGFPRTLGQAQAFDGLLQERGEQLLAALYLEVSPEEVITRLMGRLQCEQCGSSFHSLSNPPREAGICDRCRGHLVKRSDDREEVIRARLEVYRRDTEKLIDYYHEQGMLVRIASKGGIQKVFERIRSLIQLRQEEQEQV